jgi:HK97 gp10 family phage protein
MLRDALKVAAEPIRARAAAIAPRAPGLPDLADHIVIGTVRGPDAAVAIGPEPAFFYGSFLEWGHRISEGRGDQLNPFRQAGGGFVAPEPFMRPAFDGESQESVAIMSAELWRALAAKGRSTRSSGGGGGLE